MGWVGLVYNMLLVGLGLYFGGLGWVGLGFKKLTHVHVWVTIEGEQETALKLLNGTNFNDLEWPLTQISRSRYYSTSVTRKWYKIELYLQWTTNKKSHMVYRTAPFSMTLNDPNLVFKVTPFFDTEYLTNGYRYGHSYYERRIGNHTQAFKCYHFQWP